MNVDKNGVKGQSNKTTDNVQGRMAEEGWRVGRRELIGGCL